MDTPVSAFAPGSLPARLLALLHGAPAQRRLVAAGGPVFRQGDPAHAVFLLETGRVRLTRCLADGSAVTLHVVDAGESFAEASLSAGHYHCDAIAETAASVLTLPKRTLLAALAADPQECLALALALTTQIRALRAALELRNIRSSKGRMLAWLRLHAAGSPPQVVLQRPWTLIADEVGLTHEAVYRALAALEQEGSIRRDAHGVKLLRA